MKKDEYVEMDDNEIEYQAKRKKWEQEITEKQKAYALKMREYLDSLDRIEDNLTRIEKLIEPMK